ncbi:MAG: hypothetical protein JW958_10385 [Candidatus Eisenbacteria bacterium]|nr:hypothetical protein [Candidatus Eisenbacteria bacterium]
MKIRREDVEWMRNQYAVRGEEITEKEAIEALRKLFDLGMLLLRCAENARASSGE